MGTLLCRDSWGLCLTLTHFEMCAKVPKAINRQNNNSADESMTGRKLKTTMALDSTGFYHVKYLGRILKITH